MPRFTGQSLWEGDEPWVPVRTQGGTGVCSGLGRAVPCRQRRRGSGLVRPERTVKAASTLGFQALPPRPPPAPLQAALAFHLLGDGHLSLKSCPGGDCGVSVSQGAFSARCWIHVARVADRKPAGHLEPVWEGTPGGLSRLEVLPSHAWWGEPGALAGLSRGKRGWRGLGAGLGTCMCPA